MIAPEGPVWYSGRRVARLRNIDKKELFGGKRSDERKKGDASEAANVAQVAQAQEEIERIERELNELRAQYELYFMGVEKLEPVLARDALRSQIKRLRDLQLKSTAMKFKIQQLQARLISLETYWGRINRQREAGTYYRDLEKVRRREAELAKEEARKAKEAAARKAELAATASVKPGAPEGQQLSGQALRSGAQEAVTASGRPVPPQQRGQSVARPVASRPEDLSEPALRQLYETYATARRRCGEQVDLRYEEMASSLRKQVPKLLQSTGAKAIEFKVVIKSGHAVLKAVPKT
jgi:hypothetical protein